MAPKKKQSKQKPPSLPTIVFEAEDLLLPQYIASPEEEDINSLPESSVGGSSSPSTSFSFDTRRFKTHLTQALTAVVVSCFNDDVDHSNILQAFDKLQEHVAQCKGMPAVEQCCFSEGAPADVATALHSAIHNNGFTDILSQLFIRNLGSFVVEHAHQIFEKVSTTSTKPDGCIDEFREALVQADERMPVNSSLLFLAAALGNTVVLKALLQSSKLFVEKANMKQQKHLGTVAPPQGLVTSAVALWQTKDPVTELSLVHLVSATPALRLYELLDENSADEKKTILCGHGSLAKGALPTHTAADAGNYQLLQDLINATPYGSDLITVPSKGGWTPLHHTINTLSMSTPEVGRQNQPIRRLHQTIDVIVKAPTATVLLTLPDKCGRYPLHLAARGSSEGQGVLVIRALLDGAQRCGMEKVANLAVLGDKKGFTPLHTAALAGEVDILRHLLFDVLGCCSCEATTSHNDNECKRHKDLTATYFLKHTLDQQSVSVFDCALKSKTHENDKDRGLHCGEVVKQWVMNDQCWLRHHHGGNSDDKADGMTAPDASTTEDLHEQTGTFSVSDATNKRWQRRMFIKFASSELLINKVFGRLPAAAVPMVGDTPSAAQAKPVVLLLDDTKIGGTAADQPRQDIGDDRPELPFPCTTYSACANDLLFHARRAFVDSPQLKIVVPNPDSAICKEITNETSSIVGSNEPTGVLAEGLGGGPCRLPREAITVDARQCYLHEALAHTDVKGNVVAAWLDFCGPIDRPEIQRDLDAFVAGGALRSTPSGMTNCLAFTFSWRGGQISRQGGSKDGKAFLAKYPKMLDERIKALFSAAATKEQGEVPSSVVPLIPFTQQGQLFFGIYKVTW